MNKRQFTNRKFQNPSLRKIAEHYADEYESVFREVKQNWNRLIRSFLAKSMGVSLKDEKGSYQIPIKILPAYDDTLLKMIERQFPELDFEEFQILSNYIESGKKALPYFPKERNAQHHLVMSLAHARKMLNNQNIEHITKNLFQFLQPNNPDIFGAYFYKPYENWIELYVVPCVLFCQLHGLDLKAFAVVVLTHELAHGYNHIGRDKDNHYWKSFGKTETHIVEGLAQYYTAEFLPNYLYKNPRLVTVFEELLKHQPEPYTAFKSWNATLEQMYAAFIEVRRNETSEYEKFKTILDNATKRIK